VADLFSARGYNIESLTVAQTTDTDLSRITCATTGSERTVEQIVKHLQRLIDVLHVVRFPVGSPDFVAREMLLVKLRAGDRERAENLRLADKFEADVVDDGVETVTIEVTGDPEKLDAMLEALKPVGILEIARTGQVAMAKGTTSKVPPPL
jgi:acetolactate synthase-1/3 small subunit